MCPGYVSILELASVRERIAELTLVNRMSLFEAIATALIENGYRKETDKKDEEVVCDN